MALTQDFHRLSYLAIVFISLAISLPIVLPILPKFSFWLIILTLAAGWFLIQMKLNWKNKSAIKKALMLGLFLMIFDFIFENLGATTTIFGTTWRSFDSLFFVLNVPSEIMLITLLGGTAWALYLPKKFNFYFSIADISLFATYGMIGEYILSSQGLMQFAGGWTPLDFVAYFITWAILHFLVYGVIKVRS